MTAVAYTWHVLAVTDLQASKTYFIDKLGFELLQETVGGKAFLKLLDFRVMLGECPDARPANDIGDHAYFAYVVVKGIEGIHESIRSRGGRISSVLEEKPWGMKEFNVETPDGHRLVFGEELG